MIGRNNMKERMQRNEVIVSAMVRFPNPAIVEIMALAGVDMIILDNEHYPFDEETMINLVRAADVHNMACLVRVPNTEPARISQIMDYGVDGIMAPSVETYEEAMELVNAVKYAPVGTRGFCPITRAANYGLGLTPAEFAKVSNEKSIVMVQIETRTGMESLDAILTIPEVDAIDYGPSDLAASYGIPGQNNDPRVLQDIETIIEKSIKAGKHTGRMAQTPEAIKEIMAKGAKHVMIGSDQQMLMVGCRALVGAVE